MSMLFSHSSPVIKERLQGEKFRITDSLSESLVRSLSVPCGRGITERVSRLFLLFRIALGSTVMSDRTGLGLS
jgi:hypothetical protein